MVSTDGRGGNELPSATVSFCLRLEWVVVVDGDSAVIPMPNVDLEAALGSEPESGRNPRKRSTSEPVWLMPGIDNQSELNSVCGRVAKRRAIEKLVIGAIAGSPQSS